MGDWNAKVGSQETPGVTGKFGLGLQNEAAAAAAKSLQSCPTLATPLTAAHQAPLSMGFSRQKYWSGVPLPSPPVMLKKLKLNSSMKTYKTF